MARPFASVVIPTRNRPGFLRESLRSLRQQTFDDFEVIVADNHAGTPVRDVFDEFAVAGWRYQTPERPLAMHDNWEYACSHARGDYVLVLIDKTILLPSALELMHRIAARDLPDVVTWRNEDYSMIPGPGFRHYTPDASGAQPPARYQPLAELAAKMRFDVSRSHQGLHYYRGKLCFGAYHRRLIERITAAQGRLFYPASPDYTSMIAALAFADSAIDVGCPLLISTTTEQSNGARCALYPSVLRDFLLAIDPTGDIVDTLPLRGLYASSHNCVAHDYVAAGHRLGARLGGLQVDRANLILRAFEDLHGVEWNDDDERAAQQGLLRAYFDALPVADRARVAAGYARFLVRGQAPHWVKEQFKARFPRAAPLTQRLLRAGRARAGVAQAIPQVCESIGAAAQLADSRYRPRVLAAS